MPNQERASAWMFGNSSVRVGTQGLFRLYLKTFVPPFLPTRLTAPGSPRMGEVEIQSTLGPWTILYITVRRAVTPRSSSDRQPINYVRHAWLSSTVVSIQGHPTTVFAAVRIYVRRSKYYLEFSITWGRLEVTVRFMDNFRSLPNKISHDFLKFRLFTVPYFFLRSFGYTASYRNAKHSISTILRKNRGLWTVYLKFNFSHFTPQVWLVVVKRKPKIFVFKNAMERGIWKILTFT